LAAAPRTGDIMSKFIKRVIASYIEGAGSYRLPMIWTF
jgi:hypothetical protein